MSHHPLAVGDRIPSFIIHDHDGVELNSEDLIGTPFVLYFYPKDDTPGCTKEACAFRDHRKAFEELNMIVIGVSPDSQSSHVDFVNKFGLNFPLLCDEQMEIAQLFGAVQEKEGEKKLSMLRSTFLIDAKGVVRWMEKPVDVEGHVDRVFAAAKELIK